MPPLLMHPKLHLNIHFYFVACLLACTLYKHGRGVVATTVSPYPLVALSVRAGCLLSVVVVIYLCNLFFSVRVCVRAHLYVRCVVHP